MPSLPKPTKKRWEPARAKPVYKAHAERTDLYDSPLWRRLRKAQLDKEPLCAEGLKRDELHPATVADHIVPVRDGADFFDATNLQSLCKPCHHRKSAREGHARRQVPR